MCLSAFRELRRSSITQSRHGSRNFSDSKRERERGGGRGATTAFNAKRAQWRSRVLERERRERERTCGPLRARLSDLSRFHAALITRTRFRLSRGARRMVACLRKASDRAREIAARNRNRSSILARFPRLVVSVQMRTSFVSRSATNPIHRA